MISLNQHEANNVQHGQVEKLVVSPVLIASQSGVTLVEVMISGALGAVLMLAISNTVMMSGRALKGFNIRQELATFREQLNATLGSPDSCKAMFVGSSLDPTVAVGTVTSIGLVTPYKTYNNTTPPNNKVGDDLTITAISFTKTLELLPNAEFPGANFFMNGGVRTQPIVGTLTISLSNDAVLAGTAFGGREITMVFPVSLTFTGATAPYTVKACTAELPAATLNTGWRYSTLTNPALCDDISLENGQVAACNEGMYIYRYEYVTTPVYRAYCNAPPPCACSGGGGSGMCWGWCSTSCIPHANPNADGSDFPPVNGTYCDASPSACFSCAAQTSPCSGFTAAALSPHLKVTCCKVLR